jgi:hypothetical protein
MSFVRGRKNTVVSIKWSPENSASSLFDEVDCWFFDSLSMRYHVHSLGKNSSSFASVYWNRIERKKNSFFSLSLSRIGSYYLIISFAFSLSLFRSFTRLTDRLNISHVINLYNHPTNRFNEKNYIQCEKYVFVILKKMANQHQLLYDVVLNVSDDVLFIYFCLYIWPPTRVYV